MPCLSLGGGVGSFVVWSYSGPNTHPGQPDALWGLASMVDYSWKATLFECSGWGSGSPCRRVGSLAQRPSSSPLWASQPRWGKPCPCLYFRALGGRCGSQSLPQEILKAGARPCLLHYLLCPAQALDVSRRPAGTCERRGTAGSVCSFLPAAISRW